MIEQLPGIYFQTVLPPLPDRLPRMDIAAFVGFAAAGPINVPVLVEDVHHFRDIFGPDLPIAWDEEQGQWQRAYLGPAVDTFFANGGRRCWIVRVAQGAVVNHFGVPGLLRISGAGAEEWRLAQARARSEGSWSDAVRVGTVQGSEVSRVMSFQSLGDTRYEVELAAPAATIIAGDLLRLTFGLDGPLLYLPVQTVMPATGRITATGRGLWFSRTSPDVPLGTLDSAELVSATAPRLLPVSEMLPSNGSAVMRLNGNLEDAPIPGDLLRLRYSEGFILFTTVEGVATETVAGSPPSSPPEEQVRVLTRDALWVANEAQWVAWHNQQQADSPPGETLPLAEKMHFDLWAWNEQEVLARLQGLDFAGDGARFWADLPTDELLYTVPVDGQPRALTPLEDDAAEPRFPLAGPEQPADLYIPLNMSRQPDQRLTTAALQDPTPDTAPVRDGLASFSASLFMDSLFLNGALSDISSSALLAELEYRRYVRELPLSGIHAVFPLNEVSLIAVPDAVHRAWQPETERIPPPPAAPHLLPIEVDEDNSAITVTWEPGTVSSPPQEDDQVTGYVLEQAAEPAFTQPSITGRYTSTTITLGWPDVCTQLTYFRVRAIYGTISSPWSNTVSAWLPPPDFDACQPVLLPTPVMLPIIEVTGDSGFWLEWTSGAEGASYELQEAGDPLFDGARVFSTSGTSWWVSVAATAAQFYRVRQVQGELVSAWSNTVFYPFAAVFRTVWRIRPLTSYDPGPLRALHSALLRFCAARADLFALLALPGHYRSKDALGYVDALRLESREEDVYSYGALYHPWLYGRTGPDRVSLQYTPPDGAVCGTYAARALDRGAWVAPANSPLEGVLALRPSISRDEWAGLYPKGINVVRQEPRGFILLSAETLTNDPDFRLVNVRRLMILLRRLALREGQKYVFQNNDSRFRRLVRHKFNNLLGDLFRRGAFAGRTSEEGFQVRVHDNPQMIDAGRLIVELRVAPSHPMAFITVRLVQLGHEGLAVEAP